MKEFNKLYIILILIIILSIFMRTVFIVEKPLSLDEPHTVDYVDRSFNETLGLIASEYRTPFYYLSIWVIYSLTNSVIVLKLLSVLLGILTVLGVYFLGKIIFTQKIGLFAALILAIHPVHIAYSQYVREYSMLFFFFVLSMIFFYMSIRENKKTYWIMLVISNTLMFMTHFLSLLLIFSQFVGLLLLGVRNKIIVIRNFILHGVAVFLASLPWLFFLFNNVELLGIGDFVRSFDNDPTRIFYALYKFSIGVNISGFMNWFPHILIIVIPFFSVLLLLAFRYFYLNNKENGKILFIGFILPSILLFLISVALNEALFIYRYFSPVLLLYVLIISAYTMSIKNKKLAILTLILLIGLYGIADIYYYSVITLPDWPLKFGI